MGVQVLLDHGASLEYSDLGITYPNNAIFGWDQEALELLLAVGGEKMVRQLHMHQKPANALFRVALWVFRMMYYSGDRRWWVYIMASTKGNTGLHAAVTGDTYAMTKAVLR